MTCSQHFSNLAIGSSSRLRTDGPSIFLATSYMPGVDDSRPHVRKRDTYALSFVYMKRSRQKCRDPVLAFQRAMPDRLVRVQRVASTLTLLRRGKAITPGFPLQRSMFLHARLSLRFRTLLLRTFRFRSDRCQLFFSTITATIMTASILP